MLEVSRSGYYQWLTRPPSARAVADAQLSETISRVHYESRGTCGSPRVHAELRLGLGIRIGRKRVARLMRAAGLAGVCHRRKRRGWRPAPATHLDLVQRRFVPQAPDTVWFTDITQHRAADGWVYCCAVIDGFSRRVVGWSIADHIRTELVVDALQTRLSMEAQAKNSPSIARCSSSPLRSATPRPVPENERRDAPGKNLPGETRGTDRIHGIQGCAD